LTEVGSALALPKNTTSRVKWDRLVERAPVDKAVGLSRKEVMSMSETIRVDESLVQRLPTPLVKLIVNSVAFSPDGTRIATGCWSSSGWVKTWDLE
jgi:hypothetical protein